jgi:hypothetical protein
LLELKTLHCRKQTQQRQKKSYRQFLLIKRYKNVLNSAEWTQEDKMAEVALPYILDAVVPAPHLGFVQVKGSQSFLIG